MQGRILIALSLAVATLAPNVDAKCMRVAMVPYAITPKDTLITGGGVLIGIGNGKAKNDDSDTKPVEQPTWRFRHDGKLSAPTIKTVAPGLAVYELAAQSATITLLDDKQRPLVTVKGDKTAPPEMPAPKITKATGKIEDEGRWTNTILKINLASAPPANAIAMILYAGTKPVSWTTTVERDQLEFAFYTDGHCGNNVPGTSVPTSGDIAVAWVDAAGRVSPRSNASAVRK